MDLASSGLMYLRPVTFRYKDAYTDGSKPLQYGLIAEDVADVYPDVVTYSEAGEVETVQYPKINAMLLNEVQKQHRLIEELQIRLDALGRNLRKSLPLFLAVRVGNFGRSTRMAV